MVKKVSIYKNEVREISETRLLTLFTSNYNEQMYSRKASRILGISHRTALLALDRLVKVGVLKYERVGRNKEFFLDMENPMTILYLTRAEFFKTMKFLARHFVMAKLMLELNPAVLRESPLLIFGSYAKGEETEQSDIDLLLVKDRRTKNIMKIIKNFEKIHNIEIQVQRVSREDFEAGLKVGDRLFTEVFKNHVLLNDSTGFMNMFWRCFNE